MIQQILKRRIRFLVSAGDVPRLTNIMEQITAREISQILNIRVDYVNSIMRKHNIPKLLDANTYDKESAMVIVNDMLERQAILAKKQPSNHMRDFKPDHRYCTFDDIQKYCGLSRTYIYKYINGIKFETSKKNKKYFLIADIEKHVIPNLMGCKDAKKQRESFGSMCEREV